MLVYQRVGDILWGSAQASFDGDGDGGDGHHPCDARDVFFKNPMRTI